MSTKEEFQEKVKYLQKKIDFCKDDREAICLQKELVDLMRIAFKNKEFLIELIQQKK